MEEAIPSALGCCAISRGAGLDESRKLLPLLIQWLALMPAPSWGETLVPIFALMLTVTMSLRLTQGLSMTLRQTLSLRLSLKLSQTLSQTPYSTLSRDTGLGALGTPAPPPIPAARRASGCAGARPDLPPDTPDRPGLRSLVHPPAQLKAALADTLRQSACASASCAGESRS